jgi:hypothetical protein
LPTHAPPTIIAATASTSAPNSRQAGREKVLANGTIRLRTAILQCAFLVQQTVSDLSAAIQKLLPL